MLNTKAPEDRYIRRVIQQAYAYHIGKGKVK